MHFSIHINNTLVQCGDMALIIAIYNARIRDLLSSEFELRHGNLILLTSGHGVPLYLSERDVVRFIADSQVLEEKAKQFATDAHAGAVRKYTGEAYITHPAAVVEIIRGVPHTKEQIAAGWLHDVVEDTDVTLEQIISTFGAMVGVLVEGMTDISKLEDGNRAVRKELDRSHSARATPKGKTIKIADLLHNTESIALHDATFYAVYKREKALLLDVLVEGDASLWERAVKQLTEPVGA